ncbi:MAG: hypothetical protein JWM95_4999 [Gemmatimonadetes bacterium]|nr:hypothetical protein [Gemmatimonadota bacterium]
MIALLKALALSLIAGRTVAGASGLLMLVLVPIAAVLKFIGLPILIVLAIVGAPIFLILSAVGLPLVLVAGIGAAVMLAVGAALALGFMALKFLLPVLLVVLVVRWVLRRARATPAAAAPVASAESAL